MILIVNEMSNFEKNVNNTTKSYTLNRGHLKLHSPALYYISNSVLLFLTIYDIYMIWQLYNY